MAVGTVKFFNADNGPMGTICSFTTATSPERASGLSKPDSRSNSTWLPGARATRHVTSRSSEQDHEIEYEQ